MLALGLALGCGRTGLEHNGERRASAGDGGAGGDGWQDDDGGDDNGDDDGGGQSCREVDFLFVIDNSGSMADNQAKLVGQYDTFIDGIVETIERVESIHVGVVTTDAYGHNTSACRTLGGLVVETGGSNSSKHACGPYTDGKNYMTDVAGLDEAFSCAARVGTDGSGAEASIGAAVSAISSPLTDAGSCNDGFIRDGALLVLVIVTDEDIDLDPLFAITALDEAKGNERDIVLVALANGPDSGCAVDSHGKIAYGLADLTNLVSHGFIGPICAPDYAAVFTDALDVVRDACPGG